MEYNLPWLPQQQSVYIYIYIYLLNHVISLCRNPDYHQRPSAAEIRTTLCKSELFLFSWENENVSTSSKAKILGSPLEESKDLFEDLQTIYTTHT